jgi:hypothetical protein
MQMNENAPCVLLYGHDPMLVGTRAKVIQTGGFRVCEAKSESELAERLKPARCKVLVLCHSLSEQHAEQAALLAKQNIPEIKIIAMEQYSSGYDEMLGSFVRPEEMLAVLTRVLH